jgi:MFS family permease
MSRMIADVIGSTTTGVLFATTGQAWPVFIVDAATFVASVVIVLRVHSGVGAPSAEARVAHGGFGGSVLAGLRMIASSPTLIATVAGLSIAMLGLGAVNVLFIPFLINTLGESAAWTGPIEAAQTASMVLAAGLVGTIAARFRPQSILVGGMLAVGLAIVLVAATPNVLVLLVLMFSVGWAVTPVEAAVMTLVQTGATDAMRGRVLGALNASQSTTTIVSQAAAGIFAGVIGVRMVLFLGGVFCFAAAIVAWLLFAVDRRRSASPAGVAIAES